MQCGGFMNEKELRDEFEKETGEKWWTNPVSHGEMAFASWNYQLWLEKKLSTAFINGGLHQSSVSQFEPLVILRPLIMKYQRHKIDYDAISGKIVSEGYGTQIYQALQNAEQELITKLIELVGAV
jgi:hypothetical protein